MFQILKLNRIASYALKCGLLVVVLYKLLQLIPGCVMVVPVWAPILFVCIYDVYLSWMNKAMYVVLSQLFVWCIAVYWMLRGSLTDGSLDHLYSRARHLVTRTPYVMVVFMHFCTSLLFTFVLLTIINSLSPGLVSLGGHGTTFFVSFALSLVRYLWPFLFVFALGGIYIALILPVVVLMLGMQRFKALERVLPASKQESLGRFFGGALGALLMVATMEFVKSLPVNPADIPPNTVPNGLTSEEYYDLGVKYKDVGWPEKAREALHKAVGLDPVGPAGAKARLYIQARLPRYPVIEAAEKRNIEGYNQLMSGDIEGARKTFESLIDEFPQFEWPYGNLASIYIQEKNLDQARRLLDQALSINESYLNGLLQYADLHELEGDTTEMLRCLEKAQSVCPEDESVKMQLKLKSKDPDGEE